MILNLNEQRRDNNASAAFIELIESRTYQRLKQAETFLKQAKEALRFMLEPHEGKRHEFKNLNWVAKFVAKSIWETDHNGIIEELLCYVQPEIAFSLIKLDVKSLKEDNQVDMLNPFILPTTSYIRPTLNKKGKSFTVNKDYLFGGQSVEELVAEILTVTEELQKHQERYEDFKKSCLSCPDLRERKKVTTPYGSISLLNNKPEWDLERVFGALGEEFLINYGKVDMTKIDEYILKGIIPKSVVSAHRKLVDIRVDFVVMDIAAEERAMQYHRSKQINASLKRYA